MKPAPVVPANVLPQSFVARKNNTPKCPFKSPYLESIVNTVSVYPYL